ncbi:NAD(P)-dependent oxidoreductase [Paenibacillus sp. XY044]|uniref:NAD(P)-dependent oxidoreductase n=1 Tax=Paenibacillus sp. XY044 TaxID=2026089 RepID=UPI000B98703A|nr:NAD(P)-dependent oxidoreductase [Paenibacillus sp. XY044]OZB93087.1 3-beta hydroxysteroid dehydrogenase [Paenibacillus sp. XY044]
MHITIFGASGQVGKAIVHEALKRGHGVTAVVRDPAKLTEQHERLNVVTGNILDPASVTRVCEGQEVVISAYGPTFGEEQELLEAARSLIEGVRRAGVKRLLIVGGAGSLKTGPDTLLMDAPEFPQELVPLARAHADAYHIYSQSDLDYSYLSPAAVLETGRRTGNFRIGMDMLISDELGDSRISVEDLAAALIDEMEDPYFVRTRFTVAY